MSSTSTTSTSSGAFDADEPMAGRAPSGAVK
jgi:hypothetical protein